MNGLAANEIVDVFTRDQHELEVCPIVEQTSTANILYAEGDMTLRYVTTQTLTRTGYQLTTAEDGNHAWEALHTHFVHITPYRHWGINE